MAKRQRNYTFNSEWEYQYCFIEYKGKSVCLLCNGSVSIAKKCNVERHFFTNHNNFNSEYPVNSELRRHKVMDLKSKLTLRQSVFTKPVKQSSNVTIASYKICHVLAKRKKPFSDGEIVKEAMISAAETLFDCHKDKSELLSSIKSIQLSHQTVARRVEQISNNLQSQLHRDFQSCEYFSLQLDESTDILDTAQLCVFIRMAFSDFTVKEEFVKLLPLSDRTRGQDIFNVFLKFVKESNLPLSKLVAITTDGAPSMTGKHNGFLALCAKDESFPKFLSYHCIIHQEALCAKVLKFEHVMKVVTHIVNYIRSSSTRHRLFKTLLNISDAEHDDVILYAEVRWLSRGKTLERFCSLLTEIREFLKSSPGQYYGELDDISWLQDLAFLTDITSKLNELNLQLQGKDRDISGMISSVNAFQKKLKLWVGHLNRNSLSHFPNLKSIVESISGGVCDLPRFVKHLETLTVEFGNRFSQFSTLEPMIMFINNPFASVDITELGSRVCEIFGKYNLEETELEILNLQEDISLKSSYGTCGNFWALVDKNKYPMISSVALKIYSCFGSTYLCEVSFSSMNIIKGKNRSCLTDSHLDDALRAACSSYTPEFPQLAANILCQISH
jgi:hypothetical protein